MSRVIIDTQQIGTYTSGNVDVIAFLICDTTSDLPASTDYNSEGLDLIMGSRATVVSDGSRWMMNSSGTWVQQPADSTISLDLSGYYTSAQTDSAISTALASYTDTAGMTAAIAAANYFLRGSQITATSDSHFDLDTMAPANDPSDLKIGAWFFGASIITYIDNLPPSYTSTAGTVGGNIRIRENQGSNRYIMEITANSAVGSGVIWRRWYTSAGWSSWYKETMTVDT